MFHLFVHDHGIKFVFTHPALENVFKTESNVDGYINIGDVVNYGPWSNECVELIDSLDNCYNIKGNHEVYFEKGICDVENKLVQDFFNITYKNRSSFERFFLFDILSILAKFNQ